MEVKPSQYEAALRLVKGAEDALEHLAGCLRRKEELSRLRRTIEDVESRLKKLKQELRIG